MSQEHHSTPSAVLVKGPRMSSEPHPPSGIPPAIQSLLPARVSSTQGISPSFAGQFSPFRSPSMITPINTGKLESESGTSFSLSSQWAPTPDFQPVSSDVAGTLGYGAMFAREWFSGTLSLTLASLFMAYKELFPLVVAAALCPISGYLETCWEECCAAFVLSLSSCFQGWCFSQFSASLLLASPFFPTVVTM